MQFAGCKINFSFHQLNGKWMFRFYPPLYRLPLCFLAGEWSKSTSYLHILPACGWWMALVYSGRNSKFVFYFGCRAAVDQTFWHASTLIWYSHTNVDQNCIRPILCLVSSWWHTVSRVCSHVFLVCLSCQYKQADRSMAYFKVVTLTVQ